MAQGGIRVNVRNQVTLDNASLQRTIRQIESGLRRSVSIDGRQIESVSRPLGKITGQADEFTKSLEASNARVIAFGASVAIINGVSQAFAQLVENTIRVEKTLADINVVLGGTTRQLNQFKDAIFETAKNTAQSFDIVAEGALEFARQGLSMEESIKRINDALILTRLTGIDVTSAVEGLTAAVNAFAKEGLSTTEIINKLSAVDVAFAVSSEDLINSLSRASSVANDAGVSFDELISITAALQETTARGGAVIGNALKSIFTRIQRPATLSSLQELGVAVQDLEGNILPATKLLEGLAGKVDQLSDLQRSQIFGEVAGLFQINQLIAAVTDLGSANSRTAKAIQVSASATDEAYRKNEQLNTTLSALLSQTGTGVEQLFSRIGEIGLTDDLKTIIGGFSSVIEFLNKALSEEEGNKIAKGFVKGIGGALTSAPFLGLLTAIIAKLSFSFIEFGVKGLKSFLGLNKAAEQQKVLQQSILQILLKEPAVLDNLLNKNLSRVSQEKVIFELLKQQELQYQKIANLAKTITPGLYRAGARTKERGVTVPTSADGYMPAVAKENRDIAMGVGGAKSSDKSVVIPNFSFGRGKKGPMVANTGEYIVPNYAMGGDAIFNRDMVDKMGMPKGAMKINAAGGYIPNFAGIGLYDSDAIKDAALKRTVLTKILENNKRKDVLVAPAGAGKTTAGLRGGAKFIKTLQDVNKYSSYRILSATGRSKKGGFTAPFQKILDAVKRTGGEIEYLYVPNAEIDKRRINRVYEGSLDGRDKKALKRTLYAPRNQFDFMSSLKGAGGKILKGGAEGYIPNFAKYSYKFLLSRVQERKRGVDEQIAAALENRDITSGQRDSLVKTLKELRASTKGVAPSVVALKKQREEKALEIEANTIRDPKTLMIVPNTFGGELIPQTGYFDKQRVGFNVAGYDTLEQAKGKLSNDEQIEKELKDFSLDLAYKEALKIGGGLKPKKRKQVSNVGALSGMAGSIFESAIQSIVNSPEFTNNNETFDFVGKQYADKLRKGLFSSIPSTIRYIDAKIRPSRDNNSSFAKKVLTVNNLISKKKTEESAALGYIPNFAKTTKEKASKKFKKNVGGNLNLESIANAGRSPEIAYNKYKKVNKEDFFERNNFKTDIIKPKEVGLNGWSIDKKNALLGNIVNSKGQPITNVKEYGEYFEEKVLKLPKYRSYKLAHEMYGGTNSAVDLVSKRAPLSFVEVKSGKAEDVRFKFYRAVSENINNPKYGRRIRRLFKSETEELIKSNNILIKLGRSSSASGYIPNFAQSPLEDAIAREQAAGVPINQIRVNQNGKLRNSQNPMGLAVTNTRDEPTGAIPNFAKKSSSSDNSQLDRATGGALEKIFVLQTVAAGLTQAFSSTTQEAASVGEKLSIFSTEVVSAVLSLSLLKAQAGQVGLGQLLGFGGKGKTSGPWNAGLKKADVTRAGFDWNSAGAQAYRAQNPSGMFKFLPKLGGFGKIITRVGASFTKFLPAIGQAIFAFQILNSAVKAVFGKSIIQAILDPFRDKTKLAAESLDKLSKSAVEAASKGAAGLASIIDRIEREQDARKEKGENLTEDEKTKIARQQDLSRRSRALFGETGISSDIFKGTISEIQRGRDSLKGRSTSFQTINVGDEKVGVFRAAKIQKFLEKTEEETSLNIQELAINLSEFLKESGASKSQLKEIQTAYDSGVEKFRNSIIEASTKGLSDEELQTEVENAYKTLVQGFRDVSEPIENSLKQAIAATEAQKRIFATDFARSIKELYFSANLNSERNLFKEVSSISKKLADQTISETERFYLQRQIDEKEFNQKQQAARRQSQQKVIDAYLADIQAVQTLPAETANKALRELNDISNLYNLGILNFEQATSEAQTVVSTALGADAPRENLLNAQQEKDQKEKTLQLEKERFDLSQDTKLIERNTREEREKSLRILNQQLDIQKRLAESQRDYNNFLVTNPLEQQKINLEIQLANPTLDPTIRTQLQAQLDVINLQLSGIGIEQSALESLTSDVGAVLSKASENFINNARIQLPSITVSGTGDIFGSDDPNKPTELQSLYFPTRSLKEDEKSLKQIEFQRILNELYNEQFENLLNGRTSANDFIKLAEQRIQIEGIFLDLSREEEQILTNVINKRVALYQNEKDRLETERKRNALVAREANLFKQGKAFQVGVERAKRNLYESSDTFYARIGQEIPESFANNLSQALVDASRGAKSLKEALLDAAQSFLATIQQAFMQRAVNQLVDMIPYGQSGGTQFASGGYVSGGSGVRDDVPAMLMAGEYVIKKDAVNKYGVGFLSNLNQKAMPTMQEGGFYLPGMYGQGSLKGKDLEAFVNQRRTSGQYDKIGAGGINLEAQSSRLTTFGLTREDNPMLQSIMEAQNQGMDLLIQKEQYEAQQEKAFKEGLKQLGVQALSAVATYGLSQGIQAIGNKIALSKVSTQLSSYAENFGAIDNLSDIGKSYLKLQPDNRKLFADLINNQKFDAARSLLVGGTAKPITSSWKGNANGGSLQSSANSMIMGGEFVMGRQAVQQYGKNYFDSINNMTAPAPRFAQGGLVGSEQTSSVGRGGDTNITINVSSSGGGSTNESSSRSENSQESDITLAEKIKKEVVRVIEEEKRVSGSLSSRRRGV